MFQRNLLTPSSCKKTEDTNLHSYFHKNVKSYLNLQFLVSHIELSIVLRLHPGIWVSVL